MSMNKYMHPRNIYKTPPDFRQLAMGYPEFKPFVHYELNGKVTLDFKDVNSLRALTTVLLKHDFQLDVEIPLNKLIPTVPLRLNYILWLEDLLDAAKGTKEQIRGLDIGTGASCIYPLIAAKKNQWRMVATEKDAESVKYAMNNIARNKLEHLISTIHTDSDGVLKQAIENEKFDFCMCNPPFFASVEELHPFFKSRTSKRPHPKNAFVAHVNEVVAHGGEVEFILKLIEESKQFQDNITIFSTMIGHKTSVPVLRQAVIDAKVFSYKESKFCQGYTTRWALAWTFQKVNLHKTPDAVAVAMRQNKSKGKSLKFSLPGNPHPQAIVFVSEKLLNLFKELQLVVEEVTRQKNHVRYMVTAFSNTWANARRKRRSKLHATPTQAKEEPCAESNESQEVEKDKLKRVAADTCNGASFKKLKITSEDGGKEAVYYKFMVGIIRELPEEMYLDFQCRHESNDRNKLYEIMQYVKNNLKV